MKYFKLFFLEFLKKINNKPLSIYRALRHLNPSPYLFYMNFNNFSIVGSSPEILIKLDNKKVTIRPIAGTRKRGANKKEDDKLKMIYCLILKK